MSVLGEESECHGLRERKKARTRRELRAAALERARVQGPDGFTVEEICADVDVSPRTFFNHFPTKDAVLFGWSDSGLAELAETVRARAGDSALAVATSVLGDVAAALTTSPIWHGQLQLIRTHPELNARMAEAGRTVETTVAQALAERGGRDGPGVDDRIAAATAMGLLHVTVLTWLDDPSGPDARVLYDDVVARARDAFASPAVVPGGLSPSR
ncbi:TetR/AcrR family transcriptional regulator [Pseudonocardia phyllosphaerae]|uniref:TetR/AcrR family transcriptional regulator n=1 Tax=Pseudonocardia phyllosphaerae TaxID=3390502 RepID=UPI0039799BE8